MSGKFSYQYPHFAVTTDAVVFGFDGKTLHTLLIERGIEPFKGSWALPGGFLNPGETVEECCRRELHEETNVDGIYLEEFQVFSAINRDPRERVITIAFFALVKKEDYHLIASDDAQNAQWFKIDELPPLAFDHQEIINASIKHIQEIIQVRPIIFELLDEKFSIDELQRLYEIISGEKYDRRNFRRKVVAKYELQQDDIEMNAMMIPEIGCPPPSEDKDSDPPKKRKRTLFSFNKT